MDFLLSVRRRLLWKMRTASLFSIPWMIYNPGIKNPTKKKIEGSFYSLSLPTTILDLMVHTNSFQLSTQDELAQRFAQNYEFANHSSVP